MAAKKMKATSDGGGSDPVARARSVLDLIRADAPRIDAARELTPDVMTALHRQRLFRILLPAEADGEEIDLVTFAKVIETIAAVDASTAWCLSQGAGCAMGAAFLRPAAMKRLFGPDNAVLAWGAGIQGKATKVEGGYRVTGTWTFASGSRHATILGGHSHVFDKGGQPVLRPNGRQLDRTLLFLRSKAIVHDVWQVVGLKGTGSDTFEVRDLFVPDDETIDRENPAELHAKAALFVFPGTQAYAVGFTALMLGIARGMLDELKSLAMTKTPRGAAMSLRESPVFQSQLSVLEARLRSLRAYLHQTAGDIFASVAATRELPLEQRVEMKLCTTHCINEGVQIAVEAYRAAGQTAIFLSNPFERRMRDALTASQQTQGRPSNFITIGRCLMGLEPDTLMFL